MTKLIALAAIVAGVALPAVAAEASHSYDGYDRHVTVINNSSRIVYRIRYGIPGRGLYGRDLLGSSVLPADAHVRLNFDNGNGNCTYLLRAETASRRTMWTKLVNVCRASTWSLAD